MEREEKGMAVKRIDDGTRRKVRESYANGVPKKRIAEEFSISVSSVTRIIGEKVRGESQKTVEEGTRAGEIKARIADIERRITELEDKILRLEASRKKRRCWF
jgi:transposase